MIIKVEQRRTDMKYEITVTVYNEEDFLNAVAEIKSNLDYDNIEYDYTTKRIEE